MVLLALTTSDAVPPGVLTLPAWDALRAAEPIVACAPDDPTAEAVRRAGIAVAADPESPGADLTDRLSRHGGDVVWIAPRGACAPEGMSEVIGSTDPHGASLIRFIAVMDRLRTECPWDREQTHESLASYLLEETYEVLEALDARDTDALREELGDLLFQVYFHARLAAERDHDPWTIEEVAAGLVEKLVRRHPHVFADVEVRHAGEVEANWDRLKAAEKQRDSVLDGVPAALPALAYADKVLVRLRRAGLLDDDVAASLPDAADTTAEQRIGAELLRVVAAARTRSVDAESALRRAVRDLARRTEGSSAANVRRGEASPGPAQGVSDAGPGPADQATPLSES